MRLRQVLKNVWIFCCIICVVRHVSHLEQDWLHIGVENAEFGSYADSSRCPDVFEHDESSACV